MDGAEIIAEERRRQIEEEGYTLEHDAAHRDQSLATAAACYALPRAKRVYHGTAPDQWPWHSSFWNGVSDSDPSIEVYRGVDARISELKKAGALIAAEIDRLRAL